MFDVETVEPMVASLMCSARAFERRHHLRWMIGSLALIWALWVLPLRLYPSQTDGQIVEIAFFALTGILLGVGRQGIDLMGVRLFVASMAVLAAVPVRCSGFGECVNAYEIGVPALGLFGSFALGLVAIPTNVLWNRGFKTLAPEFGWNRLSTLKGWQWVLLGIAAFFGLTAFYVSLGIPAY